MECSISLEDIKEIKDYLYSGELVSSMNEAGLSFGEMAFILQELQNSCQEVTTILEKK